MAVFRPRWKETFKKSSGFKEVYDPKCANLLSIFFSKIRNSVHPCSILQTNQVTKKQTIKITSIRCRLGKKEQIQTFLFLLSLCKYHTLLLLNPKKQQNFPPSLAQRPCNAKSKTSQGPFVISEKNKQTTKARREKTCATACLGSAAWSWRTSSCNEWFQLTN